MHRTQPLDYGVVLEEAWSLFSSLSTALTDRVVLERSDVRVHPVAATQLGGPKIFGG